jgi:hypothetical protein
VMGIKKTVNGDGDPLQVRNSDGNPPLVRNNDLGPKLVRSSALGPAMGALGPAPIRNSVWGTS